MTKRRFSFATILFWGISGLTVAIYTATFIGALSWINKPFPGFLTYDFPRVGSFSNKDWPGILAGLKLMEKIVAVEDQPVHRGADVVAMAQGKTAGTPVAYTIESGGESRKIVIPTATFVFNDYFLVFLIPFVVGLIIFFIGFLVYLLKPNTASSWVFYFSTLFISCYSITGFEIQSTYQFVKLHYFIVPLIPASLVHLGAIFPERKRLLIRFPALEYLIYLPAFILVGLWELFPFAFPTASRTGLFTWVPDICYIFSVTRIYTLLCLVGLIILVFFSLFKASTSIGKQRARMILFGVAVSWFLPGLIMVLVHFLGVNFPWNFITFFGVFFPASIAYSIIKHNLFDSDAIIKRTIGYVVVTAVVVGAYVLVSVSLNVLLGHYQVARSRAFPVLFALGIILIFNPLRNWIQSLVDRVFFRKEYDAKQIIDRLGAAMTSLMELPQVLRQLVQTFNQDMFIDTSAVLLLDPSAGSYQVRLSEGEKTQGLEGISFQKTEPLTRIIENEKKEITKYDVMEDPKYRDICLDCAQNFSTLNASLIVPMVFRNEVIGFLSLGEKKSGKFYNREDVELLKTLANQGAVAIENARMAEQMKNEETVRANLARYLSPQIVDQIIREDVQVNLGGDRKVVTVLFSDIRKFTTISESMAPDQLAAFLNEYFTEMAQIIFDNQGSLDKYIGDAIVAVFGSLIQLENSSRAAVQAAIQMMERMAALNRKWEYQYGFTMEMGIGVNTGEVFLGNVGSPERMEFTVIGDTVNVASRFSGLARGGQILVTKETLQQLPDEIRSRELEPAEVKGKTVKVEVFEIIY